MILNASPDDPPLLNPLTTDEDRNEEEMREDLGLSELQQAVVGHVVGFIVRKMSQKLLCSICVHALMVSPNIHAGNPHLQLILAK